MRKTTLALRSALATIEAMQEERAYLIEKWERGVPPGTTWPDDRAQRLSAEVSATKRLIRAALDPGDNARGDQ